MATDSSRWKANSAGHKTHTTLWTEEHQPVRDLKCFSPISQQQAND